MSDIKNSSCPNLLVWLSVTRNKSDGFSGKVCKSENENCSNESGLENPGSGFVAYQMEKLE